MSIKKSIVTGGAGFIGSHLTGKLLEAGHEVVVIDDYSTGRLQNLNCFIKNPMLKVIEANVNDIREIKEYFRGADYIFHLASLADIVPSVKDPLAYHRANVDGTVHVMEAVRECAPGVKKVLYAASSSCYGIPDKGPTLETEGIKPQYPYAFTKYLGENIALHWAKVYKLPVISLRLFNVYGPRSRTSGVYGAVFGVFLAQKLGGKPFTVVGDGSQRRDFIYISDVVEAFLSDAFSEVENEVFNVGSGRPQSINRLVSLLGGQKIYISKRPGEPDCTWADITKITSVLGWQPRVSFREGVRKILGQIDYWKDAPVWTPKKIDEATREWFKCLSG